MTLSGINILTAGLLLAGAALLTGCSSECTENKNALPRADFMGTLSPGEQLTLTGLQIEGVGAPGDSLLIEPSSTISEFYIPFRIDTDRTVYRFTLEDRGLQSEVTFDYDRIPTFVSAECGVSYRYEIRDIVCSGTLIDSVTCPDGYIDNRAGVNLHIWLSPAAYELPL